MKPMEECAEDAAKRGAFLRGMSTVPGSVAIIAAANGAERTGLAATAWTSLCADPPMMLACINRDASAHALIRRAGAFSLNVVPASATEIVAIFSAQRGLQGTARFVASEWTAGDLRQPLLKSAVMSAECTLEAEHVHGTHSIFIGRVKSIRQMDGLDSLLYFDRAYAVASRLEVFAGDAAAQPA